MASGIPLSPERLEEAMSLLDAYYKSYNIMGKSAVDSPEGGWVAGWVPGETVQMALDDPTQTQKLIADSRQVEVIQNAVFPIGTPIAANTYLRAVDDQNAVYMVQTNPVGAPSVAGIQVIKAEVRKTRLPA